MSAKESGEESKAFLRRAYVVLDDWHAQNDEYPPRRPHTTSELAVDDLILNGSPISEWARLSLAISVDHLRFARNGIAFGQPHATAPQSAIRGAFVGACQAVWVLAPNDRATRQKRGLMGIHENYRQMRIYNRTLERAASLPVEGRPFLRARAKWLEARLALLESLGAPAGTLDMTGMVIPAAPRHTFPSQEAVDQGLIEWRRMSADAHILGWSVWEGAQFGEIDADSGLAPGTKVVSWDAFAQPFIMAFHILNRGRGLFEKRSGAADV